MEVALIYLKIEKKQFANRIVFDNFEFHLNRGQSVGLMGHSGVGKTTLLRIIAGLDMDFEGIRNVSMRLAVMFQEPNLIPWRSVKDNLKIATKAEDKKIIDALKDLGMAERLNEFPENLSLGQQRRIALVRACLYPHDCLLLDEPFASLDQDLRVKVKKQLQSALKSPSISFIIISHDRRELEGLVDEIITIPPIRDGQIDFAT